MISPVRIFADIKTHIIIIDRVRYKPVVLSIAAGLLNNAAKAPVGNGLQAPGCGYANQ
jgi:hypothetical protein